MKDIIINIIFIVVAILSVAYGISEHIRATRASKKYSKERQEFNRITTELKEAYLNEYNKRCFLENGVHDYVHEHHNIVRCKEFVKIPKTAPKQAFDSAIEDLCLKLVKRSVMTDLAAIRTVENYYDNTVEVCLELDVIDSHKE